MWHSRCFGPLYAGAMTETERAKVTKQVSKSWSSNEDLQTARFVLLLHSAPASPLLQVSASQGHLKFKISFKQKNQNASSLLRSRKPVSRLISFIQSGEIGDMKVLGRKTFQVITVILSHETLGVLLFFRLDNSQLCFFRALDKCSSTLTQILADGWQQQQKKHLLNFYPQV